MSELQPDSMSQNAPPPAGTLASRLTDVFISPSEVFDGVRTRPPQHSNWFVPLIAAIIVGILSVVIMFSQPAVIQAAKEAQDKKFQELVDKGKMSRQDADKTRAELEKVMTPTLMKTIWSGVTIIANVLAVVVPAGVLWVLGRFLFQAHFSFLKSMEVAGLALMIAVLGAILNLLLGVIYGNISMNAGPILLVGHFDHANKVHRVLGALNLPELWYIAVLSMGLARLSKVSFWKPAACLFGLWAVLTFVPIWLFNVP